MQCNDLPSFIFVCSILLLTTYPLCAVQAQEQAVPDISADKVFAEDDWHFQLTPYVWFTGVDADTQVGALQSEVNVDFSDIVDQFNVWGAMGRFEAQHDRLTLFVDGMYTSVDRDETFSQGPVSVQLNADFKLSTVELGATYELFDHRFDNRDTGLRLEALGGGRYTYYKSTLGAVGLGPFGLSRNIGGSADWVEPFVGARARFDLTDTLAIRAYGDIGGFDVGEADLSWKARVLLDWQLSDNLSLLGGYQAYGLDFQEGSGRGRIGFDGVFHGPIFGIGIRF